MGILKRFRNKSRLRIVLKQVEEQFVQEELTHLLSVGGRLGKDQVRISIATTLDVPESRVLLAALLRRAAAQLEGRLPH